MKNAKLSFVFIGIILLSACGNTENTENKEDESKTEQKEIAVIDKDGNEYQTIIIGKQEWLSTNLNTSKFQDGNVIKEAKTDKEWIDACEKKEPVWRYYNSNPDNGDRYGKLYNWYAVNDSRKLAPDGYHIPTLDEWERLIDFLGGYQIAGEKIKSNDLWASNDEGKSGNGNNESRFNALPSGCFEKIYKDDQLGTSGYYWTTSTLPISKVDKDENPFVIHIYYDNNLIEKFNADASLPSNYEYGMASLFANGYSVRCLKD